MEIVLCPDNHFTPYCCVLLASILLNNSAVTFHIISSDLTDENKEKIKKSVNDSSSSTIFYDVPMDTSQLPVSEHAYVSKATYNRLFVTSLLPEELHKVLYLDCDMIVTGSILPLWETNIETFSAGAVPDINNADIRIYNRLDYPLSECYFNAGMLLINLDWFRKNNVCNAALSFVINNPEKCPMHDQDALNHVLHGTWKALSASFNTMIYMFRIPLDENLCEKKLFSNLYDEVQAPVIIHYAGSIKPWMKEYKIDSFPFFRIWENYMNKSNVKIHYCNYLKGKELLKLKIKLMLEKMHLYIRKKPDYFVNTNSIERKLF